MDAEDSEIISLQSNVQSGDLSATGDNITKATVDNDTLPENTEIKKTQETVHDETVDTVIQETQREEDSNIRLSTPSIHNPPISISESDEDCLETKLLMENDIKTFLDDENSDMQDEEIQLRWDDDDDDDLNLDSKGVQGLVNSTNSAIERRDNYIDIEKDFPKKVIHTELSVEDIDKESHHTSIQEEIGSTKYPDTIINIEKEKAELYDSVLDISEKIKTEHGLKKPDMMLEIPTQELVDFMDDDDDDDDGPDLLGNLEMSPDDAGIEINESIDDDIENKEQICTIEPGKISNMNTKSSDLRDKDVDVNEIHHLENDNQKQVIETEIKMVNLNQTDIWLETESPHDITDLGHHPDEEKFNLEKKATTDVVVEPQPSTSKHEITDENSQSSGKTLETDAIQGLTDTTSQNTAKCIYEEEKPSVLSVITEDLIPSSPKALVDKSHTDAYMETEVLQNNNNCDENPDEVRCVVQKGHIVLDVTEKPPISTPKDCISLKEIESSSELSDHQNEDKEKCVLKNNTLTDIMEEPQSTGFKDCINKNIKGTYLETKPEQDLSVFNEYEDKIKCILNKEETITDLIEEPQPSTSKAFCLQTKSLQVSTDLSKSEDKDKSVPYYEETNTDISKEPSSSQACMITEMRRDSDEVGEVSDSLGLLAESSRVLEYDEEQDDDDDGDDDDDFDDEESCNQMIAEYSEDSNAVQSESDLPKNIQMETDNAQDCTEKEQLDTTTLEPKESDEPHTLQISDVKSQKDTSKCDYADTEPMQSALSKSGKDAVVKDENIEETVDNDAREKSPGDVKGPQNLTACNIVMHKEDDISSNKLKLEKEKEAIHDASEQASQSDIHLKKQQKESDSKNDESIELLESSSEDDLLEEKQTTSYGSKEAETPVTSEDVSRSSLVSEVTEKCSSDSNSESKANDTQETPKISVKQMLKSSVVMEVFNVDSDDDDTQKMTDLDKTQEMFDESNKCVNAACKSTFDEQYYVADAAVLAFYEADCRKNAVVCEPCAEVVAEKNEELIEGIKTYMPLLEMDTGKSKGDFVEISDSESEDEEEVGEEKKETIGLAGAKLIEEQLADMINATWEKFKMDSRLNEAQSVLQQELSHLDKERKEIDAMLNDCEVATDKLRNELYATFEHERKELPAIIIIDTPNNAGSSFEEPTPEKTDMIMTRMKRRLSIINDIPAKKLSVSTAQSSAKESEREFKSVADQSLTKVDDDNVDVAVVNLSAEVAPADLPPPGEINRPPLRVGMNVFAMRNMFGIWLEAKIVELHAKNMSAAPFTMCRVRFEHKVNKNPFKLLPARCIAYSDPPDVRLTIGTRIIAATEQGESFYSGVVAEVPNPVNSYRYLVFFDDGHAKYARHSNVRLVCECSALVWEEVHPYSRDFVRQYLVSYPERPMVRLHPKQSLKTEWNGKWWNSHVMEVDASLALIMLAGDRLEWIYRGSTRLAPLYLELQAAERHRARPVPRSATQHRTNMPYVEYTRYDEQPSKTPTSQTSQQNEEMRRQRAVAKKSTSSNQQPPPVPPNTTTTTTGTAGNLDSVTSRVVYYTPKNAVRPYKLTPHTCGPKCKRTDVLALKDLRTYNPLAKPLLSGWERQIVRFKGHKEVMYRAPCGRRLRTLRELHRYLRAVRSDLPVDLFDFGPATHCLAEFVLNKCIVGKKDLSHGKEIVPVPCVNYYDETLPEFCSYNTERTPTAGVPLNLDPEFLCGCDCEDDCEDKNKCACWQLTLEGARTIGMGEDVGYVYRRLPEPLPSGIYECNSRCKCKSTCLNRVAQHPLQLKLQVFKTLNRGWGIRALNDVPKGSFLCVYAGNLLTDATANLDGLNEGDEYLAELDYIEVVEQMKEGYEEDIPESLKETDKRNSTKEYEDDEDMSSEEEEPKYSKEEADDDFQPDFYDFYDSSKIEFNKRLRNRDERRKREQRNVKNGAKEKEKEKEKEDTEKSNGDEDCITISDDEEVREPSRFTVQAGMDSNQLVSKYRSVRSYFGKDEACYIMDAKVQGNIGRYLNHSCCPNVFVQNVFVDTHDPRFPWVAFFALSHIRAGTELTWNYNYDVGSVPGKVLYCYCGAANCRGRLL